MTNIEKVIRGVKCCSRIECELRCDICPYDATDEEKKKRGWTCHWDRLKTDVLEILETTVPHILTDKDLRNEAIKLVYLETREFESSRIEAAIVSHNDRDKDYCTFYVGLEYDDKKLSEYGKTWRCWDKFPDVKQLWKNDHVDGDEIADEETETESMHRITLYMNSLADRFNHRNDNQ